MGDAHDSSGQNNCYRTDNISILASELVGIALAYPLNISITKKERERLAPEILKLTTELMNGQA